jgi:hypothetical protein
MEAHGGGLHGSLLKSPDDQTIISNYEHCYGPSWDGPVPQKTEETTRGGITAEAPFKRGQDSTSKGEIQIVILISKSSKILSTITE